MEFEERCEAVVARLRDVRPGDYPEGLRLFVARGPTGSAMSGVVVAADLETLEDEAVAFAIAFARAQDLFILFGRTAFDVVPDELDRKVERLPEAAQGPAATVIGALGAGIGLTKVSKRLLLNMGDFQRECMRAAVRACADAGFDPHGAVEYFEHLSRMASQRPKPTLGKLGRAVVAGSELFDRGIKPFRTGEPALASPAEQLDFAREIIAEIVAKEPDV